MGLKNYSTPKGSPRDRISDTPGNFRGLGVKGGSLMPTKTEKAPKLGGGLSRPAPKVITDALGLSAGMPIHKQMAEKLMTHPDTNVAAAAKRLMAKY